MHFFHQPKKIPETVNGFFWIIVFVLFGSAPVLSANIQQEPIDIFTKEVIVQPVQLSVLIDSVIEEGDTISIDFPDKSLMMVRRSFKEFKREARSGAFPKENFKIKKRKNRINIFCKKRFKIDSSMLTPKLVLIDNEPGSTRNVSLKWKWLGFEKKSKTLEIKIPKIHYNISILHTRLLSKVNEPIPLPGFTFDIGAVESLGDSEIKLVFQIDPDIPVSWISSHFSLREKGYEINDKTLTVTLPMPLDSFDPENITKVNLEQLEIVLKDNWEGFIPIKAKVMRNHWEKEIDLSDSLAIGEISVSLLRPAIIHPQFPSEPNFSELSINFGSHVLVNKGDQFLLELSEPTATRFSSNFLNKPDQEGYKIEVVDENSCRIVLRQDPSPRSSISLEELPLEVIDESANAGLIVTYPRNLGQIKLRRPVIVVPKVDSLYYYASPVILLPEIPLNGKTQDQTTAVFVIPPGGDIRDLTDKTVTQGPSKIPEVEVSSKEREKGFYVDYLLEQGSYYRAFRRIVYTGKVELRALSPSGQPWRVLGFSDKPQSLPKIQIIDEQKILQPGDSLILKLPKDLDIFWVIDHLQDEKTEIENKSFISLYDTDFVEEVDPPPIKIDGDVSAAFTIDAEIRANHWRKSLPVEGSIKVGSPDITVDKTTSFILFRHTNRLPTITVSDKYGFLRKGDQLLFDFYFEDGTLVDFPIEQPELTMNVNGYVIRRDNEKLNRFLLTIPEVSGSPPDLEINGLLTGVITDKNHKFISMEVGIKGFKDVIKDFEPVVRSAQPGLKFQRFGGLWVANDGISPDAVRIEYHDDDSTVAFSEAFTITISIPPTSGVLWNTTFIKHWDENIPRSISPKFSDNSMTVKIDPKSVFDGVAVIGDYSLLPSGMVGSKFSFEYEFKSVSQVYSSDSVFVFHKPVIDIAKSGDRSQGKDIYVFESDSIRLNIPLITYTEESIPLLQKGDSFTLRWSNPSWIWKEIGTYNTTVLSPLNLKENSNELRFQLTNSINRGQALNFRNFKILYRGRSATGRDSLLATIPKRNYDYTVATKSKLIMSFHEISLTPDTLVWSRDKIETPQFIIKGASKPVISKERDLILRLGAFSQITWRGNYRRETPTFTAYVDSEDPKLLHVRSKRTLQKDIDLRMPSFPLENVPQNAQDIIVDFSFDGGENYPVNRTFVNVAQPDLISSDSDWRLLRSSKPQPLTGITIVESRDYSCFQKGDIFSIILPGNELITFEDETIDSVSFSGTAKDKMGRPRLSKDSAMISIPIIETFSPLDKLEINGLLVRSGIRTSKEGFHLQFVIRGDTNDEAAHDQVYIDQKKVTISNIDVQVSQSQEIYSLLESAFEVPTIRIRDDPEAPFFRKGDRLRFKFDKPRRYTLAFKRENLREFSSHQIQIRDDAIDVLVVSELDGDEIMISGMLLKKPSSPMGLHSLRCEILTVGTASVKPFVLDVPLKIAFSNDVPSFQLSSDKEFLVNNKPTLMPTLIMYEDSLLRTIKMGSEVFVRLPEQFKGFWNEESVEKINISGSGAQMINRVSFKDSVTLLIKVGRNFRPGDSIMISGIEVADVGRVTTEWHDLELDLEYPDNKIKHFNKRPKSGRIKAGEIKIFWPRIQSVIPQDIYDSWTLDPLRIVKNSSSRLDSLGIKRLFLTLEPIEGGRRNAAEWDSKMTVEGTYRFVNDIYILDSLDRQTIQLRIDDRDQTKDLLVLSEQMVPDLYLSGFKRNINSEYRLILRFEPSGPIIAVCPQTIDVDWQGSPPLGIGDPFEKGKRIRLSVMSPAEGTFFDLDKTNVVEHPSEGVVSAQAEKTLSNEISFELEKTISKGTRLVIENVVLELGGTAQNVVTILPKISVDPGFGFIPLVASQELVVNTVTQSVRIQPSALVKSDQFTDGIYIESQSEDYDQGKLSFGLEFIRRSEQDPEKTKIDNFKRDMIKWYFPTGFPAVIPDIHSSAIVPENLTIIRRARLKNSGIGTQRWQYHYFQALILHYADDVSATDSYKKAKDLGYSNRRYNDWPPIEGRDSPENLVINRVEQIVKMTETIPKWFFEVGEKNLSSGVTENLEYADDLLLDIQYYNDYLKHVKAHNLLAEFYLAKIDLALGLGDLAEADRLLTSPGRDFSLVIRKGKVDKGELEERRRKLARVRENEVVVAKKDYQGTSPLSNRTRPYRVVLVDDTGEDVRFRINSLNDQEIRKKGKKLRGDEDSTNLFGGGIYTLDPEVKADETKIKRLNIVFSLAALAILVLI
tara:strand:+ start:13767 stop:20483 length:6717 start_codon:yes stop_codon:yes gene_type:complete